MILARLLTPHEIGLYSVSLAAIGVAQVLREFGIGNYLIQEKELSDDHLRTAFGVSLLLGGSLFVLVFAIAPVAAGFYEEQSMTETLRIAALNFLILPFCTVRLALLRRAMRFKSLLYVSLTAAFLSQSTTVTLAWCGVGANSMAIGSVIMNLSMAAGTYFALEDKKLYRPSLVMWRPLMHFGGQSALTNIVATVSMDANDLVVGKVLGFGPVAILSRAQGLVNLFYRDAMGAIRNVAMPAFAQAHRSGEDVAGKFRKSVVMIALVAWPFYGWTAIYSLEALRLFFGPQWDEARPLVMIFCAMGALGAFNCLVPTLLIAIGQIGRLTKLELSMQPLRLAFVAVAALSIRTMEAVALAMLLVAAIAVPVFLVVATQAVPGLLRGLLSDLTRTCLVAALALAPALAHVVHAGVHRQEPIPLFALIGFVLAGAVLAVFGMLLVKHPAIQEPQFSRIRLSRPFWRK